MMVGTTIAMKAQINPTTRIYDSAIGRVRDLLGNKPAMRLTRGLMASAKNSAQPMISNPALALIKR